MYTHVTGTRQVFSGKGPNGGALMRTQYNFHYCIKTRCLYRHGNQCTEATCIRTGNEKRASYYTKFGRLAIGDTPNA